MRQKRRILVVDDQSINRKILTKILSENYDVFCAENGEQALAVLRGQNVIISAMLLDIVMPVMDGYAVLEQMESDPQLPHIPVIVLSQADKLESEDKALALGASDFVSKPYKPSVLLRRLSNLIEQYESTERIARMERDALTGLYSKDAFFRRAAERIAESPDDSYILVATDIERFKLVNDTYGNVVGDKLLKFISGGLQRDIDKKDGVCARFGADQFVMLIPDADNFNVEEMVEASTANTNKFPNLRDNIRLDKQGQ